MCRCLMNIVGLVIWLFSMVLKYFRVGVCLGCCV